MKRYIRSALTVNASDDKGDIVMKSDDGLFTLVKVHGVGRKDTPWSGYAVRSLGDAKDYVVEIRLRSNNPDFNGEPVQYKYYDVEVAHGMRNKVETLEETARYIEILQSALEFAKKIKNSKIIEKR